MNSQRIWSLKAAALFECDSENLASAIVLEIFFLVNAIGARNAQRVSANSTENGEFITTKMRAFFFALSQATSIYNKRTSFCGRSLCLCQQCVVCFDLN
jgi:hypothetical protein